ncbi:uncharacterized protein LOC132535911 [Erinaceus europaeus]|uniref:Uncharacterized protein LOC132535911 n=1 Tax=Erinaceus europaeus TaxID=9365 RepID=A0ABM3WS85_ERIEU|nr:uncharacterized protein LOC132535911 [Erinaceus europaeus]
MAVGQPHACVMAVSQPHTCLMAIGQPHACLMAVGQPHACLMAIGQPHACVMGEALPPGETQVTSYVAQQFEDYTRSLTTQSQGLEDASLSKEPAFRCPGLAQSCCMQMGGEDRHPTQGTQAGNGARSLVTRVTRDSGCSGVCVAGASGRLSPLELRVGGTPSAQTRLPSVPCALGSEGAEDSHRIPAKRPRARCVLRMPQGPRKAVPSSTPGQGPGGAEQQPEHEERGVQASETQCPGPSGASLLQDRQSSPGSLEAQEVQVDEAGPHRPHPGVIPEERGTERPCPSPAASGKEKETITPPAAALAAQHVLCLWKGQLWPARVLSSPGPSQEGAARGPADLELQILAAGNRVTVRDTDVKALTESYTESITYWLNSKSQRGIPHRQRETHRRALREALDILKERRRAKVGS